MGKGLALIIEDSPEISDIYAQVLQMVGYESEAIYDGRSALTRLSGAVPQLIILDMNLPHVSGHYIYKQIRSDTRLTGVPVIIATANMLLVDAMKNDLAPHDQMLVKPVSPQQLRDVLNKV
ncbi:MAG: response regulator [bacterium]|nr:response regulator [bacterium]